MNTATETPIVDLMAIETDKGKERAESRPKVRCANCGKWFDASRSDAKFCSSTCRSQASRRKSNPDPVRAKKKRIKCEQCGKSFWTARPDQARFCSSTCRWKFHSHARAAMEATELEPQ